ncbi:xanthine dehydrogenase family protein molybdopterin-binding subunit [Streptomyces paromomycinus]|uniref:Xanthine dehydrogenase n=1 Tax=Streptomyces paromomycinus TaxID=92743 RepID=A0A401W8W1_STREY|nr:xanthine dehydrogenase family protein molybdopterin-binding subunit [Streptomyces paromomycinus]GCD45757.1 xanthine dehydrogenase [Streptomyces paromomycinus]
MTTRTSESRTPDPAARLRTVGADQERADARDKVLGRAPYAFEHPMERPCYAHAVLSAVPRGRITAVDTEAARQEDGVITVLTCENAERLASTDDAELAILQGPEVAFRGQIVAAVVAETPEAAREAASLVRISYAEEAHASELKPGESELYRPETANGGAGTDSELGDLDAAMEAAQADPGAIALDETYLTAMTHCNPMEPHATIAVWQGDELTLYDSSQSVHGHRDTLAEVFGLDRARVHMVCPYVGGGFGSKGEPHAHSVLAALAARAVPGRPVKFALTRQQMFTLVGYRTPTYQRVRLAAGADGRLTGIGMDAIEQTSRIKEFAEQSANPTRTMYAAPHRRTTHRLAALDVPVPSWMRAPGECPGMFGPEVAMDELAERLGLDPVELRIRNDAPSDPETGKPFSSRNLVACLREGARRFGWQDRDPRPGVRREGRWLIGTGVASSAYPVNRQPGSVAAVQYRDDGCYRVDIAAADLGTGAWTVLAQIAADALDVPYDRVELRIGDTALPKATVAGGSSGTAMWGSAIVAAAEMFRKRHGHDPSPGDHAQAETPGNPHAERFAMHAFGAQFVEVRVDADTGEVRVPRLLGAFAAGRIINPRTARSQLIGGMTMGLSMALHEETVTDPRYGLLVNHDLANYHITANADVQRIEAHWIDEDDPYVNPLGAKGIGEIGITGTAAAVVNAVRHATGVRVRGVPVTLDKVLEGLSNGRPSGR